jgi:penicillin amidase
LLLVNLFIVFNASPGRAVPSDVVEIIRDSWGIPHIFTNTSEGAFFGLGYASAEDRMFQMEYSRRVVQGRTSEMVGEKGVASDTLWRTLGWYNVAKEVARNLDPKTQRLLQAYANGVNCYLQEANGSLLYLFDQYGIQPEPWTVADSIACWYRISLHFSGIDNGEVASLHSFESLVEQIGWENAVAQMTTPPIIDESGAIVRQEDMSPQLIAEIEEYAQQHGYGSNKTKMLTNDIPSPKASHAWVVGGARSLTGSAILHSDPQITITAPSLWYEFHISGGDFDARGIGVAGAPGMLIGWNRDIAWGATAAGVDISDLFRLQINPANSNQYYYDGEYRNMQVNEEELVLSNGTTISVTCRKTVWGPVVTPLIPSAKSGEEFAMKHAETQNSSLCSLQALVRIMEARNWTSFEDAVEGYMSVPIHLIYGDKYGNIGYQLDAGIPLRSTAWPLSGITAQPGNSSQYDWQEIVPKRYLPHTLDPSNSVISTANNMAVGAWYPLPLGLATGGTGDSIRSWRLRELLTNSTAFSQDDLLDIHRDKIDPAVREIVRLAHHIVYVLGQQLSNAANSALAALDLWNWEYDTSQMVYPLIESFDVTFRRSVTPLALTYGGGEGGLCHFAKAIKSHLDTNSSYLPTNDEKNYVNRVLATAWNKTVSLYGSDPSGWSANYDKTIVIKYQNGLEDFGTLDPANDLHSPDLHCKHISTILSQAGNSYSQNIRFDNVDLSKSVMPPGLSEDPNSTFYDDQVSLWQEGQLHEAPLTREIVESMMTSYVRLEYTPKLTGDVDGDFDVDILDVVRITSIYGLKRGDPNFNPESDLDNDGTVTIFDVVICTSHYGQKYPVECCTRG